MTETDLCQAIRAYEEGYRRQPERPDDAEAYARAAAEVLGAEDWECVPRESVANADDITTVSKARLDAYLATLPPAKVDARNKAIKFALDLS